MDLASAELTEPQAQLEPVIVSEQPQLRAQAPGGHVERNLLMDAALGALAGAAGVWAMDRIGWWMYRREDDGALQREHEARVHGKDLAHVAVDKVAEKDGRRTPPRSAERGGTGSPLRPRHDPRRPLWRCAT